MLGAEIRILVNADWVHSVSGATHQGHRHPLLFILEKRRQSACLAWSLQHVRNADPSLLDLLASSSTSLTALHCPSHSWFLSYFG